MDDQGAPRPLSPVQVHIRSFQSIDDLEFEVRGFTCITGKTNAGKSAIVRAIASAIQNAPVTGDVRRGARFCSVSLKSEKWGFVWEKGEKGGGTYHLEGDKMLDKVGQGQLDVIAEMGFGSVKVGDELIYPWLAPQWEQIFLLNKSGPSVTDFISDVSRLTVLQDAIIFSARGKKRALDGVRVQEEAVELLRHRDAAVAGLKRLQEATSELEEQADSINEYESRIAGAEALLAKITRLRSSIGLLSSVEALKVPTPPSGDMVVRLRLMEDHRNRCELAARGVIALRAVSSVSLPEPPTDAFQSLRKVARHSRIPALKKAVAALERVQGVRLDRPDVQGDMDRLQAAGRHAMAVSRSRKAVEALSKPVTVPVAPEGPERLLMARKAWKAMSENQGAVDKLEVRRKELIREMTSIQKELDTIPSCTACGRPVSGRHSHSERVRTV